MKTRVLRRVATLLLAFGISAQAGLAATIQVDSDVQHQTITGWAAQVSYEGPAEEAGWDDDFVADLAVNEAGITRLEMGVFWAGVENSGQYHQQYLDGTITRDEWRPHIYEIINDDGDPDTLNQSEFDFSIVDFKINKTVLPIRNKLAARGESLYFVVQYVHGVIRLGGARFCLDPITLQLGECTDITDGIPQFWPVHKDDPDEYAEFMLAVFTHIQDTFGFVPDGIIKTMTKSRVLLSKRR